MLLLLAMMRSGLHRLVVLLCLQKDMHHRLLEEYVLSNQKVGQVSGDWYGCGCEYVCG